MVARILVVMMLLVAGADLLFVADGNGSVVYRIALVASAIYGILSAWPYVSEERRR